MPRTSKPITATEYMIIDGVEYLLSSLPEERRREIGVELNDRALRAAGYVPVEETA